MKKMCFFSLLLVITAFQLYAQTRDILYLKNGSIINGTLVEISDNQYKIRTADKSIFVYRADEVEKYTKGLNEYEGRKKSGIGMALESGFLMGSPDDDHPMPFSFNCLVNYTLNTTNILGIGSGVEFISERYMPLFIEYKRLIINRKTAPFIFIRGGSLFHPKNVGSDNLYNQYDHIIKYKNGVMLSFGTGISWSNAYNETYLSFAYRYATTSYIEHNYSQAEFTINNYFNRLEIKFGFKF